MTIAEELQKAGLNAEGSWCQVMPGVRACRFSVTSQQDNSTAEVAVHLEEKHVAVLFCFSGTLRMTRRRGAPLAVSGQDILLLSDSSALHTVEVAAPLEGILVDVRTESAKASLDQLYRLMGNPTLSSAEIRSNLAEREGVSLLHTTLWSRAAFAALDSMESPEDQSRYCVWKCAELVYLLCRRSALLESGLELWAPDGYLTRTVAEMREYMEKRLGEKLTIEAMSRRFHISPTAFKSYFRRLYGQPVHSWLQTQRMYRAAELLYSSPMTILQIANAVGYEGVSQFNVAFKRRYGVPPRQYRKMADLGGPELMSRDRLEPAVN